MKKVLFMAAAIVATITLSSCKSQKVLSEAAEVVTPAAQVQEIASTPAATPAASVQDANDRKEKVKVVNAGDTGLLKDFNVVVGSFGNKDNAENMKRLMSDRGYNSFIVQNENNLYRVIAGGYDTRLDAVSVRDEIRKTYSSEQSTCADAWLLIPVK